MYLPFDNLNNLYKTIDRLLISANEQFGGFEKEEVIKDESNPHGCICSCYSWSFELGSTWTF